MKNNKIQIFNNVQEFVLDFNDKRIILSPYSAKKFLRLLSDKISDFENEHGEIVLTKEQNAYVQSLLKNLFHNRKVSKRLSVIGKRK